MHRAQEQVRDFHRACGLTVTEDGDGPSFDFDSRKQMILIREEYHELVNAFTGRDPVGTVHEACDLLYVVYGLFVEMGVDAEKCFDEVHRANMRKCSGPKREDGKQLKPDGWSPANVSQFIGRFMERQ